MSRIGQLYSKKELAAIDKKDRDTLKDTPHATFELLRSKK